MHVIWHRERNGRHTLKCSDFCGHSLRLDFIYQFSQFPFAEVFEHTLE